MTADLHRLVYYSRNRVAGSPAVLSSVVASVLAASRVNNARVGVTGALMFNAGCFAQVLEGSQSAVEQTFERIQQDERHGDVSLMSFGPAPARIFDTWSMGFVGASVADEGHYRSIGHESGFDPSRMTGDTVLATLVRLAHEEEQAAA